MSLVVPTGTLTSGDTIKICIQGSSRAGATVVVTVTNDDEDPLAIQITLDAEGNGCANWIVPPWDSADFSYGSCDPEARFIQPGP